MKIVSRLLLGLMVVAVAASCGGSMTSTPSINDYRNGTPNRRIRPESLCYKNPNGAGYICSGRGSSGAIASSQCIAHYGCTMEYVQVTTLPNSIDPTTITDGASACAAIGESFSSVQNICFILGSNGTAQFGWRFTYFTYGQCAESLTGRHPGYDYETTPTGQYVLFCVAPGTYAQPATAWYNVELTFLGFTGPPVSIGIEYAVPEGQLFDAAHPTTQSVFTKMDEKFCPSTQKGGFIGLCTASGGAVSVGLK